MFKFKMAVRKMAASRKIYVENKKKDVHNPHTMLVELYKFDSGSINVFSELCACRTETDRQMEGRNANL